MGRQDDSLHWGLYDNSNNKGERVAFGGKNTPLRSLSGGMYKKRLCRNSSGTAFYLTNNSDKRFIL